MVNKKNGSTFAACLNKRSCEALDKLMNKSLFTFLIFTAALWIFASACRKETVYNVSNTTLRFSADTIYLDTVFTSIGSSTRILKVFNPTEENISINRIFLGRGQSSYYRMNVNGESTKDAKNIELAAKDSLYIFIEVTADVLGASSLLYTDSILFETGNVRQDVDLVTLAKDAYFHYPNKILRINQPEPFPDIEIPYSILGCNTTLASDKPHVFYGYSVVDSACTLNILAGTELHFHSNSGLWVYSGGKLFIDANEQGDYSNPVLIQGDRLEPSYENIPGQWGGLLGGIFIQSGSEAVINNTLIKNATTALRVDSTASANPNITLKNVQILNSSRVGLYCGYSNVLAENVIIANGGLYLFYALGGQYTFRHSTFANYWTSSSRSTPSVGLTNFFEDGMGTRYVRNLNKAYFGNCIIYGSGFNEIVLGIENSGTFNYHFNSALLRIDEEPDDAHYDINNTTFFTNCLFNQNPQFVDYINNDYALDSLSPGLDIGNSNDAFLVPFDIKGISRSVAPDLGAIER